MSNPESRAISVVQASTATTATKTTTTAPTSTSQDDGELDFVGPSHAMKSLFTIPYATDKSVSVAVHNIRGTLLIDNANDDQQQEEPTTTNSSSKRKPKRPRAPPATLPPGQIASGVDSNTDALDLVASMLEQQSVVERKAKAVVDQSCMWNENLNLPPPEHYSSISVPSAPRDHFRWNFQDLRMLLGSDALVYRPPAPGAGLTARVENASELRSMLEAHQDRVKRGEFQPDYRYPQLEQVGKPSYAAAACTTNKQPNEPPSTTRGLGERTGSFSAPNLDQVKLQTCIVPSSMTPLGNLLSPQRRVQPQTSTPHDSAPVCTVMDLYLDNIIANVPQLALCLREKGFIQSVKLLETKDIPSALMRKETLETKNFSIAKVESSELADPLFSPEIMEMNASALLRFLKANCTTDHSTYLVRREAGEANIQLYDISAISAQRQRKWIWWLATMSYRFAIRLQHLPPMSDPAQKRQFRARQRSLLQNALNLLEDLADRDGGAHESLRAVVSENLADTFLHHHEDDENADENADPSPAKIASDDAMSPTISSPQYSHLSADALNKAQDHLNNGIRLLWPLFEQIQSEARGQKSKEEDKRGIVVMDGNSSSDDEVYEDTVSPQLQSVASQLFGLHHKLISVSLRLAELHLRNYWSSSAMQSLRSSGRRLTDATSLLRALDQEENYRFERSLVYQYTWLWEHCGHFARSFAADEHWRDRGHACGDDIISVLQDVEKALELMSNSYQGRIVQLEQEVPIVKNSRGSISLGWVTGLMQGKDQNVFSKSEATLNQQKLIERDRRHVLVAAAVAYSRAISALGNILEDEASYIETNKIDGETNKSILALLQQRLGDACNEVGKIMLNELRRLMVNNSNQEQNGRVGMLLLESAEHWFNEAVKTFQACQDLRNFALLCCNLCQCSKLRANSIFSTDNKSNHAESCLEAAADHLMKAHEGLGERDADSITWDMVSQELAATFLVLGVRRRQSLLGGGTTPIMGALRFSPGHERSIVEPMQKALIIYQDLGNEKQAAAVNYQLALFFSKVWTCQRDETKTREKLSSAFRHFHAAHSFYSQLLPGNESTFVLLCLDLANLYAVVSGQEGLTKALERCLDAVDCFAPKVIEKAQEQGGNDWFETMRTLAQTLEERILKLLVNLVKIERGQGGGRFKEIYREALSAKMAMGTNDNNTTSPELLLKFYEMLSRIREKAQDTPVSS